MGIILWREYRGRQPSRQGYRERSFPVQVKGGSHCPVELMLASARTGYCLTLKSAGLAAKLPFSQAALWEKMSGTACPLHAGNRQFPSNRKLDEGGKDDRMKLTRHNGRTRQYIAGKNGVYNPMAAPERTADKRLRDYAVKRLGVLKEKFTNYKFLNFV